ncbi:MAG: leucine-rich repeat domain-containing protein [Candidatus Anstonellales archaeon]
MIAIDLDIKGNICGYRILDYEREVYKDVTYDSLYRALAEGKIEVYNLGLGNSRIEIRGGNIHTYPKLRNKILIGKSPLILLYECMPNVYYVTNYTGNVELMKKEEIIRYGLVEGIANGEVILNRDMRYDIKPYMKILKVQEFIEGEKVEVLKNKLALMGGKYSVNENGEVYAVDKDINKLKVANGVVAIANKGFMDCINLESISLPDTIVKLGVGSFANCKNLREIVIPSAVEFIPKLCFVNCVSLERVVLPRGLKGIDFNAFKGCNRNVRFECTLNVSKLVTSIGFTNILIVK